MTVTSHKLTAAAARDLAKLRAGETVDFRVGPLRQLIEAGYVAKIGGEIRLVEEALRVEATLSLREVEARRVAVLDELRK